MVGQEGIACVRGGGGAAVFPKQNSAFFELKELDIIGGVFISCS